MARTKSKRNPRWEPTPPVDTRRPDVLERLTRDPITFVEYAGFRTRVSVMSQRHWTHLEQTGDHPARGVPVWGSFFTPGEPMLRSTPYCSNHGAMNCVDFARQWWRCLYCHLGIELVQAVEKSFWADDEPVRGLLAPAPSRYQFEGEEP